MSYDRVARDLHQLLHPYDHRDIPVPGFPGCDAVAAWAALQPRDEVVPALLAVLADDEGPQQAAAMAVLRSLGVGVNGHGGDGGIFRWTVAVTGRPLRDIVPTHQPTRVALPGDGEWVAEHPEETP